MATAKTGAAAKGKAPKKKVKKNVAAGIAHIQSTFNNTVVTITNGSAVPSPKAKRRIPRPTTTVTNHSTAPTTSDRGARHALAPTQAPVRAIKNGKAVRNVPAILLGCS